MKYILKAKKANFSVTQKLIITLFLALLFLPFSNISAQLEQSFEEKYQANNPDLPEWVQLMYAENPNINAVMTAYDAYYQTHDFVKNKYTQYYKRWLRDKWVYVNEAGFYEPPSEKSLKLQRDNYLALVEQEVKNNVAVANWEEIGPWEYDHDATMNLSVQSPGSAHVYTVEQSVSNPNVVYAGTRSAGIWKSTDKGISWELMSRNLYLTEVYSIEIDHTDENIVYFHAAGRIWKTTNGGTSWTETGGGQYFSWTRDIRMLPNDNQILLAATTDGLYRTTDGGTSWSLVMGGHFQEIEFHPTQPNTVYLIKQIANRTEFYKSTDGGLTFNLKPTGWPGIAASTTAANFTDFEINNSTHIALANVDLGSATTPDFTIEMRVKSNGWSGDPALISNKNWNSGLNKGFILAANGSGWKFNIGDGSSRIDLNGSTINDGQWHYIAVTYDADGDKKVYQDGGLVNSTTDNITTDVASGLNLGIGQDGTLNYGFNFEGSVAEVRVWNTALTETQLTDYQCQSVDNTHPAYASLLHYWKMDEGSGTTINDAKGSNNGSVSGTEIWNTGNEITCIQSGLTGAEEQKRTEIAVSEDDPNNVYVLSTGDVNGGSGLVGFYKSTDSGESFNLTCCGGQEGGPASASNHNIVGYSYEFTADGGQYYYDLGLGVSPIDGDRVMTAGISVARSLDGGASFTTNGHWVTWVGANTKQRYTHADVHDVKFFKNGANADMWVASDGGLYYSADQGDNIEPRMHGIQGTEFWGFGASYKEDAMIGGTYHNGTLLHYENEFLKGKNGKGGWFAGGAGDATKGYVSDHDGRVMFEGGGMIEVIDRSVYWKWLPFDNTKNANMNGQAGRYGNYEWHPYLYHTFFSPVGSDLWKTEDNGVNWSLVHGFGNGNIYSIRIPVTDPNIIFVVHNDDAAGVVRLWKTVNGGAAWTDITPPALLNNKNKIVEIDQDNPDNVWLLATGSGTGNKIYQSNNGGGSWSDWTGSVIASENTLDIAHHQGTNGGIYLGTSNAVFYRNNSHSDWQLYNQGMPVLNRCGYLIPYYTGGKIRVGTYRGAYQSDFFENAPPTARMAVNKIDADCSRDVFQFKDLSYVQHDGVSWSWTFENGTPATSNLENPEVSFPNGTHDVTLTVTNSYGSSTQTLTDLITVNSLCDPETVPGNGLSVSGTNSSYANAPHSDDLSFGSNTDFTITTWVKTTTTSGDATILAKKDWDSGFNNGWVFAIQNGNLTVNVGGGGNRIDLGSGPNINDGEWHHLAASFDRDGQAKMYIDGWEIDAESMAAIGNINNSLELVIGADSEYDYPLDGLIDEVCIYNAALSQAEIRERRHLTRPAGMANLVSYFQFNEMTGDVLDRMGSNHLTLSNSATRSTSTCPVGGGTSFRMDVTDGGNKDFTGTDVSMVFPATGTYPDGELVVSRLNLAPDFEPNTLQENVYFVVNNYGNNASFSNLESIQFDNIGAISSANAATPSVFKMYKRASNADGDTWGNSQDFADAATSSTNGSITFSTNNGIGSFSQFVMTKEGAVLPVEWLRFNAQLQADETVLLDWLIGEQINVSHYEIERSADGQKFNKIGQNPAKTSDTDHLVYQFTDENPLKGISYYRIKQVDLDGQFSYSDIRSIVWEKQPFAVVLYPNPVAKNGRIYLKTELAEAAELTIFDAKGRAMLTEIIYQEAEISVANLAEGVYFYQLKTRDKMRKGKLIVK